MPDADFEDVRRRVQYLEDRRAIEDCIARHARGSDRHDVPLLASAYHDDGVDEHGTAINRGPDYPGWANETHATTSVTHLHNVTTQSCEIAGDTAHAESYVLVTMLAPDGKTATVMCGRYLDRLERREGEWRIAVRRATVELAYTADASLLQSGFFRKQGYIVGTRDDRDPSYARPLEHDTPAPKRWSDASEM
jgi:ketosteroid isomerase-like protein